MDEEPQGRATADLKSRVIPRLRAVQAELKLKGADMGEYVRASRNAYSNWVSLERPEKPAIESMIILCDKCGITLDWLYRGKADGVPLRMAIRLEARLLGIDPDNATPGELAPVLARLGATAFQSDADVGAASV